jgi:hypothetical protein
MASGQKTAVKYVTGEGTPRTFAVAMKTVYFVAAATLLGAVAADPTDPQIPNEIKMRKTKVTDGTGLSRYIPVYNVAADAWTQAGDNITLDKYGVDTVFVTQKEKRPEYLGRAGKSVPAAGS